MVKLSQIVAKVGFTGQITLLVKINRNQTKALLDSSAGLSYVSPQVVERLNLLQKKKDHPYLVRLVDDKLAKYSRGQIIYKTEPVKVET